MNKDINCGICSSRGFCMRKERRRLDSECEDVRGVECEVEICKDIASYVVNKFKSIKEDVEISLSAETVGYCGEYKVVIKSGGDEVIVNGIKFDKKELKDVLQQ